jgi:hypothetical protein
MQSFWGEVTEASAVQDNAETTAQSCIVPFDPEAAANAFWGQVSAEVSAQPSDSKCEASSDAVLDDEVSDDNGGVGKRRAVAQYKSTKSRASSADGHPFSTSTHTRTFCSSAVAVSDTIKVSASVASQLNRMRDQMSPPLDAAIQQAIICADAAHPDTFDGTSQRIFAKYCDPHAPNHLASLSSEAETFGTTRGRVQAAVRLAAAVMWHADRVSRHAFERKLVRSLPERDLIAYEDLSRADEAPMSVSLRETLGSVTTSSGSASLPASQCLQDGQPLPTGHGEIVDSRQLKGLKQLQQKMVNTKANAAKLFQCEQQVAYLVRVDGEYVMMKSTTLNTIRVVDQGTAEAQKQILIEQSGVSSHADRFKHKGRTGCGDRAKLNKKADLSIATDRKPGQGGTLNLDLFIGLKG